MGLEQLVGFYAKGPEAARKAEEEVTLEEEKIQHLKSEKELLLKAYKVIPQMTVAIEREKLGRPRRSTVAGT